MPETLQDIMSNMTRSMTVLATEPMKMPPALMSEVTKVFQMPGGPTGQFPMPKFAMMATPLPGIRIPMPIFGETPTEPEVEPEAVSGLQSLIDLGGNSGTGRIRKEGEYRRPGL